MLVCHCMAVYDSEIREEAAAGAGDVFAVAEACGAGTVCGGCVPTICALLGQPAVVPEPIQIGALVTAARVA